MIHYVTVHHRTLKWVDLQIQHMNQFTDNYKLWSAFSYVDLPTNKESFYYMVKGLTVEEVSSSANHHGENLDMLIRYVLSDPSTKDDDIIVVLDSDSLPIANVDNYVNDKLNDNCFCAVQRVENGGDKFPHPSFAFCTVNFWRQHNLTWKGSEKCKSNGGWDTGGELLNYFDNNSINWYKLRRSPLRSLYDDSVAFSVYDNIVYHHGYGSRGQLRTRGTPKFVKEHFDFFRPRFVEISNFIYNKVSQGYFLNNL